MKKVSIILLMLVFLLFSLTLSGCKEVSYLERVPYQAEETYYMDERYEVDIPYTETEDYQVNESYQVPVKVDPNDNEIKDLEVLEQTNSMEEGECVAEAEIYNPNRVEIFFDVEYIFDMSLNEDKYNKYNLSVDGSDSYTLTDRSKPPYWLDDCGKNLEIRKITILDSPEVREGNRTEWQMVTKQREVTKYKKETKTRQVPKTRTVTKYQERWVTEKKLPWQ